MSNNLEDIYVDGNQVVDILNSMKFPVLGAGGGFAPIGKEGYIDGTQAPQGWLICDGSTHNIADYPELAAYFASHHGSANYYGGDGATTFAVPKRLGMPDGQRYESTSETPIGFDKDGKVIYQKTFAIGTSTSMPHGISNFDKLIEPPFGSTVDGTQAFGLPYAANSGRGCSHYVNGSNIVYDGASNLVNSSSVITLRYIKTTDSGVSYGHSADGNGVFCIKATVSDNAGDTNGHQYSTDEHKIGKWIDGSDLYEKTVNFGSLPSSGTKSVSIGNAVDKVIDCRGFAYSATTLKTLPSAHYDPAYAIMLDVVDFTTNDPKIRIGVNYNYSELSGYVTIQYTKTS